MSVCAWVVFWLCVRGVCACVMSVGIGVYVFALHVCGVYGGCVCVWFIYMCMGV